MWVLDGDPRGTYGCRAGPGRVVTQVTGKEGSNDLRNYNSTNFV